MHSTLFVATIPPEKGDWRDLLLKANKKLAHIEGVVRLAENVWLLNLQKSPASLGWLISLAEQMGVSYGVLPFEREPQWLPAGFDPKTTQVHSE